ncbi:DUF6881 domain-containing protein [Methylosinus sp. LW4]|uniref:DUF6881 domain-containing protein n=1 Tax=Methylosinus sp. LW4 TaxID=136993 RepID=UPI00036D132B|nr:hypothetical protein [Methylosinus sp. LW4]
MNYICIRWIHENSNDPVLLISELDDHRWETRKVEIFADGAKGYATKNDETGGTALSLEQVPSIDEIAADPQFIPKEITKEEFEEFWKARRLPSAPGLMR